MSYYGVYVTTNETSGNSKKIATEPQSELAFSPRLEYDGLVYRFHESFQIDTPSLEKRFIEYCEVNNIETNVSI